MSIRLIAFASAWLLAVPAKALTFGEVDVVCPLDGEKFRTVEAMSGTQFGMYLDLKPLGPIAAPWPIAKCPSSGFVVYKRNFTPEEISQLRPYVASPEYQALQRSETNYYLAAKLQSVVKAPAGAVAFTLLRATWEAKPGNQYAAYAAEALDAYKLALQQPYENPRQEITDRLVAGELERRLEKFEEAKSRFSTLADGQLAGNASLRPIVDLQLKLIAERNSRPAMVPQASK